MRTKNNMVILFAFAAIYSVCANSADITNYVTSGNLESQNNIGCVSAQEVKNNYTPVDLYKGMAICAKSERFQEAAFLFSISGVYGRFDSLRVADRTAPQGLMIARSQIFEDIPKEKLEKLQGFVSKALGSSSDVAAICKDIIRVGPPSYYPKYMVAHGMGSLHYTGEAVDGLLKNFNATSAWKKSLDSYLHCPEL